MTEAVKPPIVPPKEPPINEGIQSRLRHLREVIQQFSGDLAELQRLEKALIAANERLDRHSHLMGMETQLLEQLLKRDSGKPRPAAGARTIGTDIPAASAVPGEAPEERSRVVSIVDRVEADLEHLIAENRTEVERAGGVNARQPA